MASPKTTIGVHIGDFQVGAKQGLRQASELGFQAVEIGATQGEVIPEALSQTGRRHVQRFVGSLGLSIAALGADLGKSWPLDSSVVEQNIARTQKILELAVDLDVPLITLPIGHLNVNDAKQFALAREALYQLAEHADKVDRFLAVQSATESTGLQALLKDLNCPYLKVCYDPAEFLMDGLDPLAPIGSLANEIALSHLRDALLGNPGRPGRETNLGEGQVNLHEYLARLDQVGYRGAQILRRSQSDNPQLDLQACKNYVESILP